MYGNIKEDDLDVECLILGDEQMSLRKNLDHLLLDEDLIQAEYKLVPRDDFTFKLEHFTAWTESYVIVLITDLFDEYLMKIERHPPLGE